MRSPRCLRLAQALLQRPNARIYTRCYSTHRESAGFNPAVPLSQSLDTGKSQTHVLRSDNVGPFQLGMTQQSYGHVKPQKKWSELSTSGKVGRATARTTNLSVILIGGGLTAVLAYALVSELFSRNSPTVLYGDACERIQASPKVARYLNGPLSFHNVPPSAARPRHRNSQVHSQIAVDSTDCEHMFLHFYVSGQLPGTSKATSNPSISKADAALDWLDQRLVAIGKTVREGAVSVWARDRVDQFSSWARDTFRYVTGQPVQPSSPSLPRTRIQQQSETGKEDVGTGWGLAGLFRGLRGAVRSESAEADFRHDQRIFTDGEVHADFVRNHEGYFVLRYLFIDMPSSASRDSPVRVFVERTAGVRDNEPIMRFTSS